VAGRLLQHLSPHALWLGREALGNSVKSATLRRPRRPTGRSL